MTDRITLAGRGRRAVQRGSAVVQLAAMITVLMWIVMGAVDFGRVFSTYVGITNAARVGARYSVLQWTASDSQVKAKVESEETALGITDSMITVDRSQNDRRTVTIVFPFTPITPLIAGLGNGTSLTLTTWATMPRMDQ